MSLVDRGTSRRCTVILAPMLLSLLGCTAKLADEPAFPATQTRAGELSGKYETGQRTNRTDAVDAPCRVTYEDSDHSYSVNSGDHLLFPFEGSDAGLSDADTIELTREYDTLGQGHKIGRNAQGRRHVVLGASPVLKIGNPVRKDGVAGSALLLSRLGKICDLVDARIEALVPHFERALARRTRTMQEWSASNNAYYYYHLSVYLEGLTSMYEATGTLRYLDLAVSHAGRMMSSGKDLDGDGYFDYVSRGLSTNGRNVALYEWRGFRPLARIMRLIGSDPMLRELYSRQYHDIRHFVQVQVIEKWSSDNSGATGLASFEDDGLIHRVSHMGDILVDAAALDNDTNILSALRLVGKRVRAQFQLNAERNNALEWNILFQDNGKIIREYESLLGVSDTSHASGVVSFVVADAVLTRAVFNEDSLWRLAKALTDVIWNGKFNDPVFADFVDGGVWRANPGSLGARNLSDGWVKLGLIDPQVQALMMKVHEREVQKDKEMQLIGNLARNFALAHWQ